MATVESTVANYVIGLEHNSECKGWGLGASIPNNWSFSERGPAIELCGRHSWTFNCQ